MQAWTRPFVPRVTVETDDAPSRLRVHDTSREELVEVGPVDGTARMYVCGITPYDATHLGHANTYLTFDLMNRVWRDLGLAVNYTQNVTDVDEPLLERAEQTGVRWQDLAIDQTDLFRRRPAGRTGRSTPGEVGCDDHLPHPRGQHLGSRLRDPLGRTADHAGHHVGHRQHLDDR